MIRATWDFHETPEAYLAWLARLDPRRMFNPPALIRWNLSKAHVLELGARGASVPRSLHVPADPAALAGALERLGVREAVVKPLIGASGVGVERVTRDGEVDALAPACGHGRPPRACWCRSSSPRSPRARWPACSSTACSRTACAAWPRRASFASTRSTADAWRRRHWRRASCARWRPCWRCCRPLRSTRVDGVVRGGRLVVMEVEVNEPALGLDLVPGAADRFADAPLADGIFSGVDNLSPTA